MEDLELIELLKTDENLACTYIYDEFYGMVNGVINGVIRKTANLNGVESCDIFQESIIALLKAVKRPNFELTCKVSTLICAIATRQSYKALHKGRKFVKPTNEDGELDIEYTASDNFIENSYREYGEEGELLEVIDTAISRLSENHGEIIRLMYFKGITQEEIAIEMELTSTDSVKTQKYKAMKKLRLNLVDKPRSNELKFYLD